MKPISAKSRLLESVEQSGGTLSSLTPIQAMNIMIDQYRDERVEGCRLDQDEDMLLFQCGIFDWGQGDHFEFDMTRQFVEIDGDEGEESDGDEGESMSQLSLTFRFEADDTLRDMPRGNRWCSRPDDVGNFRRFIDGCRAWEEVQRRGPASVILNYGRV